MPSSAAIKQRLVMMAATPNSALRNALPFLDTTFAVDPRILCDDNTFQAVCPIAGATSDDGSSNICLIYHDRMLSPRALILYALVVSFVFCFVAKTIAFDSSSVPMSFVFVCSASNATAAAAADTSTASGDLNRSLAIVLGAAITAVVVGACCVQLARLLRRKLPSLKSSSAVNDPAALKSMPEAPSADAGQLEMNALKNRPSAQNDAHSALSPGQSVAGLDASLLANNPLFSSAALPPPAAPLPSVIARAAGTADRWIQE